MAGSEKDARVRLELSNSGFLSALRQLQKESKGLGDKLEDIGQKGQGAERKLHPALAAMKKGAIAAKDSLAELGGQAKSALTQVATLGGAVSFGALVAGASGAEESYLQLAGAASKFAAKAVTAADAQRAVEDAAEQATERLDVMRGIFGRLTQLGDIDQIEDGMVRASQQARRLGVEADLVARTYSRLVAKGLADSAKEAEALTEQMHDFGRTVLGVDVDEAIDPNDIAEYAAFVNAAGSSVAEMNALLGKTGRTAKDLGQALEIVEELGLVLNSRQGLEDLSKKSGVAKKEFDLSKGAVENMLTVLDKGGAKGAKALQGLLGTDRARQAIEEIFGEELTLKLASGEATKTDVQQVAEKLRADLQAAEKQGVDFEKIRQQNADLANTSAAKLRDAMNKVEMAFQKPEMIEAINDIADDLPELASAIAKFVGFAVDNPLLTGAGLVGGRAALSFGGSVAGDFATAQGTKFVSTVKASPLAQSLGTGLATFAANNPKWAAAGKALGIAAAALIAFELGRRAIDEHNEQKETDQSDLAVLTAQAGAAVASGDPAKQEKAADALRSKIRQAQKNKDSIGGFFDETFGGTARLFGADTKLDTQADVIAKSEAELRELEAAMKKSSQAGDKNTRSVDRMTRAVEANTRAVEKSAKGGGSGTNGLPPAPSNQPGSAPR